MKTYVFIILFCRRIIFEYFINGLDQIFIMVIRFSLIVFTSIYLFIYLVIAEADKKEKIDEHWKWIEENLMPTIGNLRISCVFLSSLI